MVILLNSGLFLASVMNFLTFSVRKDRSLPERSSSTKVNPPAVPIPGIAGGENAKPMPSVSFDMA
ncbi:MAG: hypothetical protein ILNGONEN_01710 [Syntrophorhabdaceae bacterium]|nr:hypothetical protein [Syntrophorhabdaceae bacterium]